MDRSLTRLSIEQSALEARVAALEQGGRPWLELQVQVGALAEKVAAMPLPAASLTSPLAQRVKLADALHELEPAPTALPRLPADVRPLQAPPPRKSREVARLALATAALSQDVQRLREAQAAGEDPVGGGGGARFLGAR